MQEKCQGPTKMLFGTVEPEALQPARTTQVAASGKERKYREGPTTSGTDAPSLQQGPEHHPADHVTHHGTYLCKPHGPHVGAIRHLKERHAG